MARATAIATPEDRLERLRDLLVKARRESTLLSDEAPDPAHALITHRIDGVLAAVHNAREVRRYNS